MGFVSSPRLRLSNVVRETRKLLTVCDITFGIAASVTPLRYFRGSDQCELQLSLVELRSRCLFFGLVNTAGAQQPPAFSQQTATIKRTVLNKVQVPGASDDVIYALVEIPANTTGDYSLLLDGQAWKTLQER